MPPQTGRRLRKTAEPKLGLLEAGARALDVVKAGSLANLDLVVLTLGAIVLWFLSLQFVELGEMSDLGLISVLPASAFLALFILTLSFCLCVRNPRGTPIFLFHIAVLIVMLYGVTAFVEDVSRLSVSWRNIGLADYVQRTGNLDPAIDASFDWPGFFALSAFLTELTGLEDASSLAVWSPVVINALYLPPLLVILRTATSDERLVWVSVWFFYLANWFGQDYFSPQAIAYLLYLVLLAVLVRWLASAAGPGAPLPAAWTRASSGQPPEESAEAASDPASSAATRGDSPAKRVALLALAIIVFAAIVPTHPLTPLAALTSVTILVALGLAPHRRLPLIAMLAGAWLSLLLIVYASGQLESFVEQIGELESGAGTTAGEGAGGSLAHVFVDRARLLVACAFWAAAVLGALTAYRKGRRVLVYGALAVAAFPLLLLQPYAEAVVFNVYLFALPFAAFFAASLFYPVRDVVYTRKDMLRSWRVSRLLVVMSLALLAAFFLARFGNERMDYFSSAELAAARRLYEVAPPGSLLIAGSGNLPWKFRDYERYDYDLVEETRHWDGRRLTQARLERVVRDLERLMESRGPRRAYLIVTRSQKAAVNLLRTAPPGSLERLERAVLGSRRFRVVYRNRDAKIFTLRRGEELAAI